MTDRLQETAGRLADTVQDAAAPVLDRASERTGQVADQVKDQATSRLDMGKEYAVEALTGVAQALRQTGQHLREDSARPTLGHYADTGAEQLERFTGYLRRRDANELLAQVEWYARRNPTTFAGGAFALGMLAARFFRSSGQRARSGSPYGRVSPPTPPGQPVPPMGTIPGPATGPRTPSTPGPGPSQGASTGGTGGASRGAGASSPTGTPGSLAQNPSPRAEPGTGGTPLGTDRPESGSRPRV